jgi:hypothetical protein
MRRDLRPVEKASPGIEIPASKSSSPMNSVFMSCLRYKMKTENQNHNPKAVAISLRIALPKRSGRLTLELGRIRVFSLHGQTAKTYFVYFCYYLTKR